MLSADDERFARRDGDTFAVAYTAAPIVADREMVGAVIVFRDITARQRDEAERATLLARVEAALAFRTRFLAITAHELKSPLVSIKGYAQLLLRQAQLGGDERLLRSLGRIDDQVDRMARLIDDLADVPQIESDGPTLDLRPLDLRALPAETVAEVGLAAPDFALRLGVPLAELCVSGDRARLQQVLINLSTNAVEYSAERREAEIILLQGGERAIITVTDYGIGSPAAQQVSVFEPYVRADNATAGNSGGPGLGLFISKAIDDRHGGRSGSPRRREWAATSPCRCPSCPRKRARLTAVTIPVVALSNRVMRGRSGLVRPRESDVVVCGAQRSARARACLVRVPVNTGRPSCREDRR